MEVKRKTLLGFALFLPLLSLTSAIDRTEFPHSFLFGTATSAFQIEGSRLGGNESNWDAFTHIPGKIIDGSNGDITDDHYNRYKEDVELMHSLGVNSYRFSISWSRVLPKGKLGEVNSLGIAFYNNLIDALLLKGYAQDGGGNVSTKDIINDTGRVEFMQSYLTSLNVAMRQGADVRGYFACSLMDNFEWIFGYSLRFGFYHVNFSTQERRPKLSVAWYKEFLGGSKPRDTMNIGLTSRPLINNLDENHR